MELKKSYRGFVVWMIAYVLVLAAVCLLPTEDEGLLTRLICVEMTSGVALLAYIIYRTEYVYWYNGTTYEDAVAAGSQRRKAFAKKHLDRFALCAAICLLYSLGAQAMGWPFWGDLCVHFAGLIWAAVSTIRFRL